MTAEGLRQAEEGVLCALIQWGVRLSEVLDAVPLEAADFSAEEARSLFTAITSVTNLGDAVDPITICAELERSGRVVAGGSAGYVAEIMDAVPTPANVVSHARIVHEAGQRRMIAKAFREAADASLLSANSLEDVTASVSAVISAASGANPLSVSRLQTVPLSSIPIEPVRWLWQNYLPLGKLVVVDGFPGQGKSTFALDIAARLSRGLPMPDGTAGAFADTVIITYEDDPGDTLRPRLEAAGGDPFRVHYVAGVGADTDLDLVPPSFPKDIRLLEQLLAAKPAIKLVIIDPLSASLGADVDSHKDQDIRRPLSRLARIAREQGVCVLIVRHVRKSPGGNAITAGGGSIGIIGQARVGLLVERHPEIADAAVLAVVKSNVGRIGPSLSFRKISATVFADGGQSIETSRLDWIGEAIVSADELLEARDDNQGEGQDARDWLRQALGGESLERNQLMRASRESGYSDRTIDRAAKRLGVRKERKGFGINLRSLWSLPNSAVPASSARRQEVSEMAEMAEQTEVEFSRGPRSGDQLFEPGSLEEARFLARLGEQEGT